MRWVLYVMIGLGISGGLGVVAEHRKCPKMGAGASVVAAVMWPAVVSASWVLDRANVRNNGCPDGQERTS